VLWPRNIEIIQKTIATADDTTGTSNTRNLIGSRHIGDIAISLLLRPSWVKPDDDLPINIGVVDQFNNQHRLKARASSRARRCR
jgi:hypothetical protein